MIEDLTARIIAAHLQSAKSGFWNHDAGCPANQGCGAELTLQTQIGKFDRCGDATTHAAHGGAPVTAPEPCVCANRDIDMKIALIHSEISEALEEYRLGEKRHGGPFDAVLYACAYDESLHGFKSDPITAIRVHTDTNGHADPLPENWIGREREYNHFLYPGCPRWDGTNAVSKPHKPVGFMSELADVCIRVFDLAGHFEISGSIAKRYNAAPHYDRERFTMGNLFTHAHFETSNVGTALYYNPHADKSEADHFDVHGRMKNILCATRDLAARVGADEAKLFDAISIKMRYNATRVHKHGKAF